MSEKNKEIVAKADAAFAKGDVEAFLALCSEDVEWTMVGQKFVKGKDAIREWLATMKSEPPKFTVGKVIAEGDFATAYGDLTMKDNDGRLVPYSYCDLYCFRNDKIVELRSFVIKTEAMRKTSSGA